MFRYVVLGLLQDGEPRHGYALMKKYRDRVGAHVSTGNFYRELQRRVEGGLVRTADRSTDGDPRRTPYAVTGPGREAFSQWFTAVAEAATGSLHEDEVSERLTFLADVPASEVRAMLDRLQDDLWMHAKTLERTRDAAVTSKAHAGTDGLPVFGLIMARRIRHVAAEVAFLGELRDAYDAWVAARRQVTAPGELAAPARDASRPRPEPKRRRG
jgi:DNA-binding PadR family transcriptional regulator